MPVLRRLVHLTFRYEWLAWVLLVAACVATWLALPHLQYRFGFKDIFDVGHPARTQYEEFQEEFGLGPRVIVYFHGPTVFTQPFLQTMSELERSLEQMPDVDRVLSALDLSRPVVAQGRTTLQSILRPRSMSEQQVQQTLQQPPFTERWHKLLYDDSLQVFVMIITPSLEEGDPRKNRQFMQRIEGAIEERAATAGCAYELNGLFFITQEVTQVTAQTQRRLNAIILPLLFIVVWVLYASFRAALALFALLAVSIFLGFGAMVAAGVPLNFMSTNFPLMILVIGTADLVHILGFFAAMRRRHGPRGAAIRAAHRTLAPNLLTTLSTIGCIYFTSLTDLSVLQQFSYSLCLGISVVYLVTIIYGPLLLRRSGLRPESGLFTRLRRGLIDARERWLRTIHSPVPLALFGLLLAASVALALDQSINSNWYRKFADNQRLPQTLSFLYEQGMPISSLDCTLRSSHRFEEILYDEALHRDLTRLEEVMRQEPDILQVFSVRTQLEEARQQVEEVTLPAHLDSVWVQPRRESMLRAYLALGAFDEYRSPRTGRLRFVAAGNLEDSRRFLELRDRLQARVAALPFEVIEARDFEITGQMIYWSHIMAAIPDTFLTSLWGSVLVVFVCFLLVVGGLRWAVLAVMMNIMPVVIMFAFARIMGWELTDNLCFLVSLAIGIAVDDTLHFLYHYRRSRAMGAAPDEAAHRTLSTVGAALIVTSVLLAGGFAVCLVADILTVRIIGALIMVSVLAALVLDLFLLPALLVWRSRRTRQDANGSGKPQAVGL